VIKGNSPKDKNSDDSFRFAHQIFYAGAMDELGPWENGALRMEEQIGGGRLGELELSSPSDRFELFCDNKRWE
jgi:hypothetical protein